MALLTSYSRVAAGQREVTAVMVEIDVLPIRRVMTGSTVRTILTIMLIILLMAGITIHGRAFVLSVDVTRLAGDLRMRSFQFEDR
jgi:hypothetical protein